MNKAELAAAIAKCVGVPINKAEQMLQCFTETVITTLKEGGEVSVVGFGTFRAKRRAGRVGVNPRNPSQKINIPPVTVAKFRAGKHLKDALK